MNVLRWLRLVGWLVVISCGIVAGDRVVAVLPAALHEQVAGELHRSPFVLDRPTGEELVIKPDRWSFVPLLFGDFDLQMEVEVGKHVDLDVLLRRVDPRRLGDMQPRFTGRFSVLRLSGDGAGDDTGREQKDEAGSGDEQKPPRPTGWFTDVDALENPRADGVRVNSGRRATVWIEARGRTLRANVAGIKLPPFEAHDPYGSFTMLAKGGPVSVHWLQIRPTGTERMWLWSPWLWRGLGALFAVVAATIARAGSRRRPMPVFGALLATVIFSLVLGKVEPQYWLPEPGAMLGALVTWTALSVLLSADWSFVGRLLWIVVVLGAATMVPELERHSGRLDQLFGPVAGSQPAEALGQLVREPGQGLVDVAHDGPRVFLLGGHAAYAEASYGGSSPHEDVVAQLELQLRAAGRTKVQVVRLPTELGWVDQQWRLFDTCYQGYDPRVVVLGISALDGEDRGTPGATSTPETLAQTVQAARRDCQQRGRQLVLFAGPQSAPEMVAQLRASADGVPVVVAEDGESSSAVAKRLGEQVAAVLR